MKKIFAALILVFVLSFPAFAEDFTIVSTALVSSDLFKTEIDDATSNDLIKLTGNYNFNTIADALSFANDTAGYINTAYGLSLELADGEAENFPDVTIKLQSTSTSLIGSDVLTFSNYGNVTTIAILPNDSAARTLNRPGTANRHFNFDNSGATVTLTNLILEGSSGVGGVEISNGTVNFDTVTFQNIDVSSLASSYGAAYVTGGTANFSGCSFTGNKSTIGGAVYVTNATGVTFDSTTKFTNNSATTSGGALAVMGSGSVTFESGVTFTGNSASTSGGAVLLNYTSASLPLTGITFSSNTTDGYGGAVEVGTSGGTLTVTGCTFTGNIAGSSGGAVSLQGGTFTLDGSTSNTFTNNTATAGEGGAIYISGATSVTSSGTNSFTTNTAGTNGGAIYLEGIEAELGDTLTFRTNTAASYGGAVYVSDSGTATFSGTAAFTSNKATNYDGGAIYVSGTGSLSASSATMTFTSNFAAFTVFSANVSDPTSAGVSTITEGFGGAVCFAGTGASTLGPVTFDSNTAPIGGAVASTANTRVTFTDTASFGTSNGNTAWTGGAVYIGAGTLTFSGTSTFENNTALDDGGAIYTSDSGSLAITTSASFTKNQGNYDGLNVGNGGAVWWGGTGAAFSSTFATTGGVTFTNNSTLGSSTTISNGAGSGGAVYFAGTGTISITSSTPMTFDSNTAYNSGGAIAAASGSITFEGVTMSDTNTATNGYGGLVYSETGTVTLNNTTIENQRAVYGGAVCALTVSISNNSVLNDNGDTATNANGGAVYVLSGGTLTVNTSTFTGNKTSSRGGAIFVNASTVTITDALFESNTANLNGGAVNFENDCTSTITSSTFDSNSGQFGGAIRGYGTLRISTSYFYGNNASYNGGSVYFSQYGSGNGNFEVSTSMFRGNITGGGASSGGKGGALYLEVDYAKIDSCTFDSNSGVGGSNVQGGAVYLDTSNSVSSLTNWIDNSTFVGNRAINGTSDSTGGALYVNGTLRIRSTAFTHNNVADTKGGGVFLASNGNLTISGTIFVGNSASLGSDFWSDGSWASMGYNRVAVYGSGSSNTSWLSNPVPDSDKENTSWTTATFYSDNVLADNEIDSTRPPYIGSSLMDSEVRLQTVMLNEDSTLALTDRATNIIPFSMRFQFAENDERGLSRRSNPQIWLCIGPFHLPGSPSSETPDSPQYTIAYVQISGVPNSIRRIGQTAALVAKVYYTNGRSAYGGTGSGEEPVKWSATPAGYLKVNADTGVITAMRVTTGESYVTLKCETVRTDTSGNPYTAIARIKIDPALEFSDLNNSPESGNSDTVQIIRDLRYEFEEYNMGYGLIDKNIEIVQSYNYADIISTIWGVENAQAIATTASNYNIAATTDNTLAYVVSVAGANEGDVTQPITYLCSFTAEELNSLLGGSYNSSVVALADIALDSETVAKLFSVLKIEFQGENGFNIPVLGSNSSVSAADAVNKGALEVTNNGDGIDIKINLMVANVAANNSSKLEITESSNADLKGAIIIPDGVNDGQISGAVVFPQKEVVAAQENSTEDSSATEDNQQTTSGKAKTTTTTTTAANSQENSSGGSSGCNLSRNEEVGSRKLFLFLVFLGLAFMKKFKRV